MQITKICIICNASFIATHPAAKMCSDNCKHIKKLLNAKKWHAKNPNAAKSYSTKKRIIKKQQLPERHCITCKNIILATEHISKKYCNRACQQKDWRAKHPGYYAPYNKKYDERIRKIVQDSKKSFFGKLVDKVKKIIKK